MAVLSWPLRRLVRPAETAELPNTHLSAVDRWLGGLRATLWAHNDASCSDDPINLSACVPAWTPSAW